MYGVHCVEEMAVCCLIVSFADLLHIIGLMFTLPNRAYFAISF